MNGDPSPQQEIRSLLEELLNLDESESLFLSCYLDTSVNAHGLREFPVCLRQKAAELDAMLSAAWGEAGRRALQENLSTIEEYLHRNLARSSRGVAVFSNRERNFLRALQLPVPVSNKLAVSRSPNVDILIELLQQTVHFCVTVFDQNSARILSVFLTDIIRKRELANPGPPVSRQPGASSRIRYEQRARNQVQHFLRDLANTLDQLVREERPQALVLLGSQANISELRKHLSPEVDRQVLLTQTLPPEAPDSLLIERALAEVAIRQEQARKQVLDQLYERLSQDYMAVSGIHDTLFQLQMGRVGALLVGAQFSSTGSKCTKCSFVLPEEVAACPYCRGSTVLTDLREDMSRIAERHDVRIEILSQPSFLDYLGGVGALLKF